MGDARLRGLLDEHHTIVRQALSSFGDVRSRPPATASWRRSTHPVTPCASRVLDAAEAGEVLVSRTVRDLATGSELDFTDRGTHAAKGVSEDIHLFALCD